MSDLLMFVCFYFRNVGLLAWLAFMDQSPQSLVAMDLGVCARERACPATASMEAWKHCDAGSVERCWL